MKENEIMVTIRCLAYNQEKYIRQCLDGFVMQKTDFPIRAIVHDDASTDMTPKIIQEYAEKYPEIIVPILEKENQYSQGKLSEVMYPYMTGKYMAICEGDDYWTDPLKLQKQVDFLESHPDYSMCFHQAIRHHEGSNKPDELYSDVEDRDYSGPELFTTTHRPATASIVIRREVLESEVYKTSMREIKAFGDMCYFFSSAHCGKVRGMSDIMSVYRINPGSVTNVFYSTDDNVLKFANDILKLHKIFGEQYKEESSKIYVIDHINLFFRYLKAGRLRPKLLMKPFIKYPIITVKLLYGRIF